MNTPTTAVTRSVLLSGRDFRAFLCGNIDIAEVGNGRIAIHVGDHSLFVDQQIIDVNQGARPEPLALPFLDALPKRDFVARGK